MILKDMLNQSAALDLMFQALADPSRRVMVETSGLVRSEKVGRVRTCRIEPTALRSAEQWIAERRTTWERRLDRLGEMLAAGDDEPDKS